MKQFILILFVLCFVHEVMAQVTGKVTDLTGAPVPFATVLLLADRDSTMVGSAITNENGEYKIENVRPGHYRQRVRSVGFRTWTSAVIEFIADNNGASQQQTVSKDLGVQVISPESTQLGEVVVQGEKPLLEQGSDGIVINVESSVMTKGSTALQLLERSPGVRIDHQNSTMELNGKNGVMVMINRKLLRMPVEQLVSFLNGMSANDIVRIELLTTPPAGFDAEGSGGVINIVMKRSVDPGTTGTLSMTGGYAYREKGMASASLNHSTDKTDIYSSYIFSRDRSAAYFFAKGHEQEPMLGGYAASEFTSTSLATQNSHNATLGIDTRPNKKTTTGASVSYNNSKTGINMINHGIYHIEPDSLYEINAVADNVNHWSSAITNVYLERALHSGEKVNLDLDYLHYNNNYPTKGQNSFFSRNGQQAGNNDTLFSPVSRGLSKTKINVGVVKMDYTRVISAAWKLDMGVKETLTRTKGSSSIENLVEGEFVTRPASVNDLTMNESISAAYASIDGAIDSSTQITAGVRYEYSRTQIDNSETGSNITDRKLSKWFPTFMFSKKINDRAGFDLSYTKRISRPSYSDLASFVTPNGPMSVNTGNPLLKPTITNNIKIGFHHSGYSFSILLSRDDHPIARYQTVSTKDGKQMAVSPQNLSYQNNLNFQFAVPIRVSTWWEMNYGFVGGWRKFKLDYTQVPAEETYFAYTLQASEVFRLPRSFAVEVSGYFNSDSYNGSRKVDPYGIVNFGIKKEFSKGGVIQLALSDVFRSGAISSYFGTLTREAFDLQTHVVYHPESGLYQTIKLTYTKSFGSQKSVGRKGNRGTQAEQERIGN